MVQTPPRSVRIPDWLWEAAKSAAERSGETVTDVIVRALKSYVRRHPQQPQEKP